MYRKKVFDNSTISFRNREGDFGKASKFASTRGRMGVNTVGR